MADLDLDAIDRLIKDAHGDLITMADEGEVPFSTIDELVRYKAPALAAEVRRLRAELEQAWTSQALLAEEGVRLRAERDALAAELDEDRHEFVPSPNGPWCEYDKDCVSWENGRTHRTARVVMEECRG